MQRVSPEYLIIIKVEHIRGVSFCHRSSKSIFSIDLWQQEKERRPRGKGIKRSIWERCPDCGAHHHSEWYGFDNAPPPLSFLLLSVCFPPTGRLFLTLSKHHRYCSSYLSTAPYALLILSSCTILPLCCDFELCCDFQIALKGSHGLTLG